VYGCGPRRVLIYWSAATLAITVAFTRLAGHNLANYPPWSNDEGELMAAGYKLATQGVLGSDMYVGFFQADQHLLETLPLQDVLQAISFRLFAPGVTQARLVSLLAAIIIVWVVGWLALRWYGLGVAILSELLLVAWRSNLTGASDGLPLLGVARTARYDVLAVAAAWLALGTLDAALRKPTLTRGLLTGAFSGLAALSQFFGAFVLPMVLAGWIVNRSRLRLPALPKWIIVGFALSVAPYAVYCAANRGDLVGQLSVYGDRGNVVAAGFLPHTLMSEPARYAPLVTGWPPSADVFGAELSDHPMSPWLLVLNFLPALAYVGWRARKSGAFGDRLLLCSVVCFGGLLWLLDETKTPLYALLLLPSICVCLSVGSVALTQSSWRHFRQFWVRTSIVSAIAIVCVGLVLESAHAFAVDWTQAGNVTPYLPLGEQIDTALSPGGVVLGPERWWWALHGHPYLSLRGIWFRWTVLERDGESPEFADLALRSRPESIVVNINVREDLKAFPPRLQDQFWKFMDSCTTQMLDIPNPNYFETEVYAVVTPPPGGCMGST
jgi:4-amino-4-deoxy-L-arabinose transferase-like glycosyltransferase